MPVKTIKTNRKIAYLFKIKVDSTSVSSVLRFLQENLARFDNNDKLRKKILLRKKFLITTPNPEQVLLANKDDGFAQIINSSTFSIPDGIGLIQAIKYLSLHHPQNPMLKPVILFFQGIRVGLATFFDRNWLEEDFKVIHGRKMLESICQLANKRSWRIAFLSGKIGNVEVAVKSTEIFNRNYKSAKFIGFSGPLLNIKGEPLNNEGKIIENEIIDKINNFKPHILFVGMTPPKQEKWVARNLAKLNVGGVMVVGGSFDYISGVVKKSPQWVDKLELEWLWRLLTQKGRLKRVLTAFPIFPLKVYLSRLKN